MGRLFNQILLILTLSLCNLLIVSGCAIRLHCGNSPRPSKEVSLIVPTTGPSLLDCYSKDIKNSMLASKPTDKNLSAKKQLCPNLKSALLKTQVLDGIERALKFYDAHLDLVDGRLDTVVGLLALREIDYKLRGSFQKTFPVKDWLTKACAKMKVTDVSGVDAKTCRDLLNRRADKPQLTHWKPASILEGHFETLSSSSLGNEGEDLWGVVKRGCIASLVNNCEVPYICGRSLGDSTPRSQYFLTHQVLYRILAKQMSGCSQDKSLDDQQVNDNLCAKMYKEAELVANLNYSSVHRHMFSEYVGFCGYLGYPNFFREDWLQNLLSWQSRSDYGCFKVDKKAKNNFLDLDDGFIMRKQTPAELESGRSSTSVEECMLQSTTIGLFTLAMHWEYLDANC